MRTSRRCGPHFTRFATRFDDPMTEVVVDKIVALAKAGEHDADRLAEHVLNDLIDDGLPPPSDQPGQDPSPQV
jgi:hypothetical protein